MRPEDTIHIVATVGTTETNLVPYGGNSSQIPTNKFARIIYGLVLNDSSGATNTITIRIYKSDGTTLEKEVSFTLGAYSTIDINRSADSPILVIPAGKFLKAVATGSGNLIINAYDR